MTAIDVTAATGWVTGALGVLAPLLVAVFNRPEWASITKQRVAIGASVVLAVAGFLLTGGLDDFSVQNLVAVLVGVYGVSQATYALIWKPTGVAPAVEDATTSVGKHRAVEE